MMDLNAVRKQILQEIPNIQKTWPRVGKYLQRIIEEKLYEQWGFQSYLEYLTNELRLRQHQATMIIDTSNFVKQWLPELYYNLNDPETPNLEEKIPLYEDVAILVEKATQPDWSSSEVFKEIIKQVFSLQLHGKDILRTINEAAAQFGLSYTKIPTENMGGNIVPRRTVWENVSDSLNRKGVNSQKITCVSTPQEISENATKNSFNTEDSGGISSSNSLFGKSCIEGQSIQTSYIDAEDSTVAKEKENLEKTKEKKSKELKAENPAVKESHGSFWRGPSKSSENLDKKEDKSSNASKEVKSTPLSQKSVIKIEKKESSKEILNKTKDVIFQNAKNIAMLLPMWCWVIIFIILAALLIGGHSYQELKQKKIDQKIEDYLKEAQRCETVKNWGESIVWYQRAKTLARSSKREEIDAKIVRIETRLKSWQTLHQDFLSLYQKAQAEEDAYHYREACALYEELQNLYRKDPEFLDQDKYIKDIVGKLASKIVTNRNNYENFVNKDVSFQRLCHSAEKLVEKENWKEAYNLYKQAYEMTTGYNPKLEEKIKALEEKIKKIEEEEFKNNKIKEGFIFYQDKWITPEQKLELEGFKKYQNHLVSGDLYIELKKEENRIQQEIELIEKVIQERRIEASKIHILETFEGKKYRVEIIEKNANFILTKVLFEKGSLQRKFKISDVQSIELEKKEYEEYFQTFQNPKSLLEQMDLIKWAKEKSIPELIELAQYHIFLIDFTNRINQKISMKQQNGIWYKK